MSCLDGEARVEAVDGGSEEDDVIASLTQASTTQRTVEKDGDSNLDWS